MQTQLQSPQQAHEISGVWLCHTIQRNIFLLLEDASSLRNKRLFSIQVKLK